MGRFNPHLLHRGDDVPTFDNRYCSGLFTTLYPWRPMALKKYIIIDFCYMGGKNLLFGPDERW